MKRAFTLAEVLITLGIIGVVASMTLPTLLAETAKAEKSLEAKKQSLIQSQRIDSYKYVETK